MAELESTVKEMFDVFDRKDFGALREMLVPESQGVDEISRRWLRSADEVQAYFGELENVVEDIHSVVSDMYEQVWGDTGLVTCWLEQDYTLEGERRHVSAPTTVALRLLDGNWRIALVHAVPLPEET